MSRYKLAILVLLGLALLAAVVSRGAVSQAQAAGLVGSLLMLILLWPMVARQLTGNPGGALRDLLLWGAAIAAIALLYSNRHVFGF